MSYNQPLAERMRPKSLEGFYGQKHLVGEGAALRKMFESGRIPSMILWGPPGVGKTTLARIFSAGLERPFHVLSAVHSGVKDVRNITEKAKKQQFFSHPAPILFIDEIHRFSKAQQDSLLGAVEQGVVTLIGATTENPSFEVIPPLLSRCQVYLLNPLERDKLIGLVKYALDNDVVLREKEVETAEYEALLRYSGGDVRKLYNLLELVVMSQEDEDKTVITNQLVTEKLQQNMALYDKAGEQHYDIISAFIKSVRGSDPNAAVYWLARMLEGGEDPKFIARRLVILAAEDIGLANPNALLIAQSTFDAIHVTGMPEARIILAEATIYLATAKKSNSAYLAIEKATELVRQTGDLPVPLNIRNAPTGLMKELGYGKDYRYAHDYPGNFVQDDYLPEEVRGKILYDPGENAKEKELQEKLRNLWKGKYKYW